MKADQIISKLNLEVHPEGGFFKETYRSESFLSEQAITDYSGGRSLKTVIYFLLKSCQRSAFHRLRSDEFWYFHSESPLEVFIIHPNGRLQREIMGHNLLSDEKPQLLLPAGTWFAARCTEKDSFTLISCSVAPGFNFEDFELAEYKTLAKDFPQHSSLIKEFT